ncbi:MAG: DUF4827 domain-containing protein [Dysgonamonadaceae bacterium]|jgi:hypothetical protein|nr:DUF4827 domain-containing protein [Dysgonamonadaceae bacterium]
MKKSIIFIVSIIVLAIASIACDNQKSLQEYLREERRDIERYIEREGIIVLKSYPKDSIFKEKEFFKTSEGLYMHVTDRGNNVRVKPLEDQVLVRFEYFYYIKDFVSGTSLEDIKIPYPDLYPMEFIYGQQGSYGKSSIDLSCNGWAIPLAYVGEKAVVDLIIPSSLGTSSDNTNFNVVFYKNLTYTAFY